MNSFPRSLILLISEIIQIFRPRQILLIMSSKDFGIQMKYFLNNNDLPLLLFNKPPFNYFGKKSGKIVLSFDSYVNGLPTILYLEFLDGDYLDQKVVQINKLSLDNYNLSINTQQNVTELCFLFFLINNFMHL